MNPYLLSGRNPEVPKIHREIKLDHQQDWVRACKEDPDFRTPSASDFAEAGPFNEMVAMGVVAVRLQGLNQELEWDGENMRFTNRTAILRSRTCTPIRWMRTSSPASSSSPSSARAGSSLKCLKTLKNT